MLQLALGLAHDLSESLLRFRTDLRSDHETHPAAGHTAKHPESPEPLAKCGPRTGDKALRIEIARPRNNCLDRTGKIACGRSPEGGYIPGTECSEDVIKN